MPHKVLASEDNMCPVWERRYLVFRRAAEIAKHLEKTEDVGSADILHTPDRILLVDYIQIPHRQLRHTVPWAF